VGRSCRRTTAASNIWIRDLKTKEIVQSRIGGQQISKRALISKRQMPGPKSSCDYHCFIRKNSETTYYKIG
jgi:hypothetical protein